MDSQAAAKKSRKNPRKKDTTATTTNNNISSKNSLNDSLNIGLNTNTNPYSNLNNIKSIKIPEKFEEKEKLLSSLKSAMGDIDLKMKTLKSRKEYYNELVIVIERELIERREKLTLASRQNSNISIHQEELYSKTFINFYSSI
jgi:hypothetical protein